MNSRSTLRWLPHFAAVEGWPVKNRRFVRRITSWSVLEKAASPGLTFLENGLTQSPVPTRKGPKLHPTMRKLDSAQDWIILDAERFESEMDLKREMLATGSAGRDEVLQASDPSTLRAQREVWRMLRSHCTSRHPHLFQKADRDGVVVNTGGEPRVVRPSSCESPLEACALLVPEDFLLMRSAIEPSDPDSNDALSPPLPEYHLAASACCFSFGDVKNRTLHNHTMHRLHEKVGGFYADLARGVGKVMANTAADKPVWRANWSISFTGSMAPHPDRYLLNPEKRRRIFPDAPFHPDEGVGADAAVQRLDVHGVERSVYLKVEYQTLHRLPQFANYVLFTVHTFLEPFSGLSPTAAGNLAMNVELAAQHAFAMYKGLDDARIVERLLAWLQKRAQRDEGLH